MSTNSLGVLPFSELWGATSLYSNRQFSTISLASLTLMNQLVFKYSSRSRPLKLAASVITVVHMAASLRRSRYGIGPALLREAGPAPGDPGGTRP